MSKPLATLRSELSEECRRLVSLEADPERTAKIAVARSDLERATAEAIRLADIAHAAFIQSFKEAGLLPADWHATEDDPYGTSAAEQACTEIIAKWLGLESALELREICIDALNGPDAQWVGETAMRMRQLATSGAALSAGKCHLSADERRKSAVDSLRRLEREITDARSRITYLEKEIGYATQARKSASDRKAKFSKERVTEARRRLRQARSGEIAGPALPNKSLS